MIRSPAASVHLTDGLGPRGARLFKAKILAAALAALLLAAAASASPGNGNGNGKENGSGSPVSVGGGGGEAKAKGSPPQAARGQARKAENAVRNAERRAAREAARGDAPAGPARINPARACKAELEELGDAAFAEEHGTNENGANAFGKCVSEQAKELSADDPGDEGAEPGSGEPAAVGSEPNASALAEVVAFARMFLQSMTELF
jgi:hypothetical protein